MVRGDSLNKIRDVIIKAENIPNLSERQTQVRQLLLEGDGYQEISTKLGVARGIIYHDVDLIWRHSKPAYLEKKRVK